MRYKKIVTYILLVTLIFTSNLVIAEENLGDIIDFEQIKKVINSKEISPFYDKLDVQIYRHNAYRDIFPVTDEYGRNLNYQSILDNGFWMYGGLSDIPKSEQKKDTSNNYLYLGYTQFGEKVPNILYNENKMKNITLEDPRTWMDDNKPYTGNVRPFVTDYTDPFEVGKMFLGGAFEGTDANEYGKSIIRHWMINTRFRDTGWLPPTAKADGSFAEFFITEDYIKHVTVTIPPTSKTSGQAIVWFTQNGSGPSETRRTFIIDPVEPLDYIAEDYTWDEESKILTLKYGVRGIDPVQELIVHELITQDGESNYLDNFYSDEIAPGEEKVNDRVQGEKLEEFRWTKIDRTKESDKFGLYATYVHFYNSHPMVDISNKYSGTKTVEFDLTDIVKDVRPTKTLLKYEIFVTNEYATKVNNKIDVEIPATALDFTVTTLEPKVDVDIESPTTDIKAEVELKNSGLAGNAEVVTDVNLHDGTGKIIDTIKDMKFTQTTLKQDIKFSVDNNELDDEITEYYIVVNANFDLTEAKPEDGEPVEQLKDNKLKVELVKSAFDFIMNSGNNFIETVEGEPVNIDVNVMLQGTTETIATKVDLYNGTEKITSKNVTYNGNGSKIISFTVPANKLDLGNNELVAVVNSNLDLTVSTPKEGEPDLSNNKDTIIVAVAEDLVAIPSECKFDGTGETDQYKLKNKLIPKTCTDKDGGSYDCSYYVCDDFFTDYSLVRRSDVEYIKPVSDKDNGIFSDDWHRTLVGQKYGDTLNVSKGKGIDGEPAKDILMEQIGYNPLNQVIQTGAGIQVKTKIKVSGYVEEFDDYIDHAIIENYIESFKTDSIVVSGFQVEGVNKNIRNNESKLTQGMEYDVTRSAELKEKIVDEGHKTLGVAECAPQLEVYSTRFEFEIPVIITTATGNIDVLGVQNKPKVPAKRKWYVYLNEMDNKYGLKIVTTIKPSLLGASDSDIECILNHKDFKFGVKGSIIDNINTDDGSSPGENPLWDN